MFPRVNKAWTGVGIKTFVAGFFFFFMLCLMALFFTLFFRCLILPLRNSSLLRRVCVCVSVYVIRRQYERIPVFAVR